MRAELCGAAAQRVRARRGRRDRTSRGVVERVSSLTDVSHHITLDSQIQPTLMRTPTLLRLVLGALVLSAGAAAASASPADDEAGTVIGIDLGTTYSCIGVYKNGKVEILANDQGNRVTPSYVAFSPSGERLIGDAAKNQASLNPENTVYDAKRLLGRRFTDATVQSDMKLWPFKVTNGAGGKPNVQAKVADETKTFAPEEVSAMVLHEVSRTTALPPAAALRGRV